MAPDMNGESFVLNVILTLILYCTAGYDFRTPCEIMEHITILITQKMRKRVDEATIGSRREHDRRQNPPSCSFFHDRRCHCSWLQQKMEKALSADLERVVSSMSNDDTSFLNIQLLSNDSSLGDAQIQVSEGQIVGDAIQAAYPDRQMKGVMVSMGGEEIDMELSFSENGIEDGARLEVGGLLMMMPLSSSPFLFFFLLLAKHVSL